MLGCRVLGTDLYSYDITLPGASLQCFAGYESLSLHLLFFLGGGGGGACCLLATWKLKTSPDDLCSVEAKNTSPTVAQATTTAATPTATG